MGLDIRKIVFSILFCSSFLLLLTSSWCFLDRSTSGGSVPTAAPTTPRNEVPIGTEGFPNTWSARAFPGYACPDDNITYEWNVGDPRCPAGTGPSCQTLTVMDNLLVLAPFTSRNLIGSQSYGRVSSIDSWSGANPVLTFSVTHDDPSDPGWDNITSEVEIIQKPPADPIEVNFRAYAVCNTARNRWSRIDHRLNMNSELFKNLTGGLGPCVRITSICYDPETSVSTATLYDPIVVRLVGGGPMTETTLSRGECADGFILQPDLQYQVVPDPSNLILDDFGESCDAGMPYGIADNVPFIELKFTLTCDSNLPECGN